MSTTTARRPQLSESINKMNDIADRFDALVDAVAQHGVIDREELRRVVREEVLLVVRQEVISALKAFAPVMGEVMTTAADQGTSIALAKLAQASPAAAPAPKEAGVVDTAVEVGKLAVTAAAYAGIVTLTKTAQAASAVAGYASRARLLAKGIFSVATEKVASVGKMVLPAVRGHGSEVVQAKAAATAATAATVGLMANADAAATALASAALAAVAVAGYALFNRFSRAV